MSDTREFTFGDDSVASGYDNVLVPMLFDPWAKRLIEEHRPWAGRRILDLATGTGIVAQQLAPEIGDDGFLLALDINPEMLALARKRCADMPVQFVQSPADPLQVESDSIDVVVCQQGFQFFPDKLAAAREIRRVLRDGGKAVATTWRGIDECEFFGAICATLDAMGEAETAEMMRTPFKMHEPDLSTSFEGAGFQDVRLERQKRPMTTRGGRAQGVEAAYATPIGPRLRSLSAERQQEFRSGLATHLEAFGAEDSLGQMVSSVVVATD